MSKYNLYALKKGEMIPIAGITNGVTELKEIDALTRKYYAAEELLNALYSEGRIMFEPPYEGVVMEYRTDGEIIPLDPLYKEEDVFGDKVDIYEQTMKFAETIKFVYDRCVTEENGVYGVNYPLLSEFFDNSRTLKDPEFYEFIISRVFSQPGVFGTEVDGRKPFARYLNYLRDYQKLEPFEIDELEPEIRRELLDNYNYAMLVGFHRQFCDKNGNLYYRGIRDYYCAIYSMHLEHMSRFERPMSTDEDILDEYSFEEKDTPDDPTDAVLELKKES